MTLSAYEKAAQTVSEAPLFSGSLTVKASTREDPLPADTARAVTATFTGATSADLTLAVADESLLDSGRLGPADLARPILAAAASHLGPGTLSDAQVVDAAGLLSDPSTTSFVFLDADGVAVAWFAARTLTVATPHLAPQEAAGRLARISNVEMTLTVQIGRTRMAVRDVLALEPGAVIELDRAAGSPADILLNGRLIARGEIVVVDQDYAIRVTQILDSADDVA